LFFNIPKKSRPPYLAVKKKEEKIKDELVQKMQEYFGWSNKETEQNLKILTKTCLLRKKYWEEEFGIDDS
jgi:hypothetical protein